VPGGHERSSVSAVAPIVPTIRTVTMTPLRAEPLPPIRAAA